MMVNLIWNEEDARKSYIEQGREEGLEQGREEGREEGRQKGKVENALENIRNLMKNFKLTAAAAMNALGISPEMQRELAPLI